MKRIHLENTRRPYVIFDDIGVQMRKKTAQGKDLTINKRILMTLFITSI